MVAPTSIKLDAALKDRLQQLAEIRRRTPNCIMREAIAQYLDREEMREAQRQDTLKARDESQATGLHVSAEEVERWLSSWGDENERPSPECHE